MNVVSNRLQFSLTPLVSFERLANLKFITCFSKRKTRSRVTSSYCRTERRKNGNIAKIQRKEVYTHTPTHKYCLQLCKLNEMEENLINGPQDIKTCTRHFFTHFEIVEKKSLFHVFSTSILHHEQRSKNETSTFFFPCFTILCPERKTFKEICTVFDLAN